MKAPVALTAYPLSHEFRRRVESEFGNEIEYLSLPELRRLPALRLLAELRTRSGRPCILALEDPASRAVLPILHAVAALTTPPAVHVVSDAEPVETLPLRRLPLGLASFAAATAGGTLAAARCSHELRALLTEPRHDMPVGKAGRILYVNANLWFGLKAGGSVGHVAGVVNGFARLGNRVELFSPSEPVLVDPDVKWHLLDAPPAFGLPIELNYPRFQKRSVASVLAQAKGPFDFVYQRMSVASYAGVSIARALGVPLVLEYNGSEVWTARHWGHPLRYERYALDAEQVSLRHAYAVVTVSRVLRDDLVERGVAPDRVIWYPNCVDERIYDPRRCSSSESAQLRKKHGIPADAIVATFVGTFGRWHGVDVLARVIARLVSDDRSWLSRRRVHFLLVGDGLRMQEARAILDGAIKAGHATLTGLVPQTEGVRYLAASDILLSPHVANADGSRFFGSPTKLFEYMAMGKGIVASALEQIEEVLTNSLRVPDLPKEPAPSETDLLSVLVRPGDEDELEQALRFLVEREDWRNALGGNARREVLARYTWQDHVTAILDGLRGTR